jgi:hypothetical protein
MGLGLGNAGGGDDPTQPDDRSLHVVHFTAEMAPLAKVITPCPIGLARPGCRVQETLNVGTGFFGARAGTGLSVVVSIVEKFEGVEPWGVWRQMAGRSTRGK